MKDARTESILRMARGAFEERIDCEMRRVVDNILDINTKATAKRKITMTIEFAPDDDRRLINVSVSSKSALAPMVPVPTSLFITNDENGEMVVAEMVPQIPGQLDMYGKEQEEPKILKLMKNA